MHLNSYINTYNFTIFKEVAENLKAKVERRDVEKVKLLCKNGETAEKSKKLVEEIRDK